MKIDPKEYRVEKLNANGVFVELDDVIDVSADERILISGGSYIESVIDVIIVTHINDGVLTITSGDVAEFRFNKRTWGGERTRFYPCDPNKNTACKERKNCFYNPLSINKECKETTRREFKREEGEA